MKETNKPCSPRSVSHDAARRGCLLALMIPSIVLLAGAVSLVRAQQVAAVPNMTGRYHFLGAEDTLAILQEETALKGYIDVFQGETESDALLSYPLTIGSRSGNAVSFRTRKIHEKYYRFAGNIERGAGKKPGDPDYLRLVGKLETITLNSVTGINKVNTLPVTFKSLGKDEGMPN